MDLESRGIVLSKLRKQGADQFLACAKSRYYDAALMTRILVFAGLTLVGLYKAGAMEDIGCSPVQILVFSSLIVAVDPVAVSYKLIM